MIRAFIFSLNRHRAIKVCFKDMQDFALLFCNVAVCKSCSVQQLSGTCPKREHESPFPWTCSTESGLLPGRSGFRVLMSCGYSVCFWSQHGVALYCLAAEHVCAPDYEDPNHQGQSAGHKRRLISKYQKVVQTVDRHRKDDAADLPELAVERV